MGLGSRLFGQKIGKVRMVPVHLKIVMIFAFFLLVSNFASNFINLMMNRGQQLQLMNELLGKELKEIYFYASNQFDILDYDPSRKDEVLAALKKAGLSVLKRPRSMEFAVKTDGTFLFFSSPEAKPKAFEDKAVLEKLKGDLSQGKNYGSLEFSIDGRPSFGFYQYNKDWQAFFVRAEDTQEFQAETWAIFLYTTALILFIALTATVLGIFIMRNILRFVSRITHAIMEMQNSQELSMVDLKGAPNDDVTYLGLSFNSLSLTIKNLLGIFRKFVTQDLAQRAYKEKKILLEGKRMNLTMLFTDIKGFTYMTETLGNDIIKLLNLHYDKAIRHIQNMDGVVGSIIGDALLAVYGTMDSGIHSKSIKAIRSAYQIQHVASELRKAMVAKRESIIAEKGALTAEEEKIYKAVLLEVGVGIDTGEVFYGTIGSYVRMTNTVIGDTVNSASRLEGLTRFYKAHIIVSEAVMKEVIEETDEFFFVELDMVQVKGKTEGKRIYWPAEKKHLNTETKRNYAVFEEGLKLYYEGKWRQAEYVWESCQVPFKEVFLDRIAGGAEPPLDWNGIWTMTSK